MAVKVTTTIGCPREVTYNDAVAWNFGGDSVRIFDEHSMIIAEYDRRAVMFIEKSPINVKETPPRPKD